MKKMPINKGFLRISQKNSKKMKKVVDFSYAF